MADEVSTPPSKLRSWLARYAFALACSLAIMLAFVLVYQDPALGTKKVLSAVGLNLLASVIFALVFTVLSARVQERNLLDKLEEQFQQLSAEMQKGLQKTATQHVPTKTYEASASYQEQFNRDVSASLRATKLYVFKGTSAKYVPARVRACRQQPQQIRIVTLDPRNDAVIRRRAVDRQRLTEFAHASLEELMRQVRDEIKMALVALFDIRHSCAIDIALCEETAVTRVEQFDDAAYISWYQAPTAAIYTFPETVRFEHGSFPYEVERLELNRRFEIGANILRFGGSQGDAELCDILTQVTGERVLDDDLVRLRREYAEFIAPFESMIQGM
jgi:hypothetical protein